MPWKNIFSTTKAPVVPEDRVIIYSRMGCKHCARAKRILKEHNVLYEDRSVNENQFSQELILLMRQKGVAKKDIMVPQVWIYGKYVGGADALEEYFS